MNIVYSEKNIKILEILIKSIKTQDAQKTIKISFKKFKDKDFDYNEIIGTINKTKNAIIQLNEDFKNDLSCFDQKNLLTKRCATLIMLGIKTKKEYLAYHYINEKEIRDYLILKIKNQKKFEELKKKISELNKKIYWVEYNKSREIIMNNKYLLSKPDFTSENDDFFDFINKNPNKIILKTEIEKTIKINFKKKIHQIVNDLGFVGEIRKCFFPNISNRAVKFKKTLTKKDFEDLNINRKKLEEQIKKLKTVRNSKK